jgi:hypothetical protein
VPALEPAQRRDIDAAELFAARRAHVDMPRLVVAFPPKDDVAAPPDFADATNLENAPVLHNERKRRAPQSAPFQNVRKLFRAESQ